MIWHAALTSDLHHTDPDKFLMGTPAEVSKSMDRTWEVFPTPERIVSDILKFPKALKRIQEVKGAVVPEMDTRTGRRSTAQLPYHPCCEAAVQARDIKWKQFEAEAASEAAAAAAAALVAAAAAALVAVGS